MFSRATLAGHDDSVYAVCFSPDGARLATGSRDEMAFVWRVDGSIEHWLPLSAAGVAVCFSTDGRLVGTGAADGTATVWRADDASRVDALPGDPLDTVAFRPGTAELFVGRANGTITRWDVASRQIRGAYALDQTGRRVTSIDFSADGNMFAAASEAGTLALVDAESLADLARLPSEPGVTVYRCVICPGTRVCAFSVTLAVGGPIGHSLTPDRFEIVSWSPDSAGPIDGAGSLVGHLGWIGGLAFSPDGTLLASGGFDECVSVWDPNKRALVATSREHEGPVYGVGLSPDGATLVSCSADRTVKLWSTLVADLRREPERSTPNLTLERVLTTMLDRQGTGRSSLPVIGQDVVDELERLDASAGHEALRVLLSPIDPSTMAIAYAVCNTIDVRLERARRGGDTAGVRRYDELHALVDAAIVGGAAFRT